MGFTIEDALVQTKAQYQLELKAGQRGCANAISWVHLIEDTTIIQQLWGKELAVTTGLGFQQEGALLKLVQCLVQYHSVGLIINTGQYIFDIPSDVIDYCNEQDFPLLTSPWEVHMADLIKDFSMRCLYSEKEDRQISKYFKNVFMNPQLIEDSRIGLMDTFDVDGTFQVILIDIENSDQWDTIERRRIAFQIELYFEKIECTYSFFWYDSHFVLIVNNLKEKTLDDIVDNMYKRAKRRMNKDFIHVGVGIQVKDFRNVILSYKRALSAVMFAMQFERQIVSFDEMGVYQVLFSIEDQHILYDMYDRLLSPLIVYDEKHHGELEKTFYYYLKYDASPQTIAEKMYTHRNTIHYRIDKIKQLLNCDLLAFEDKFPYMLAFYIRDMIKDEKQRWS